MMNFAFYILMMTLNTHKHQNRKLASCFQRMSGSIPSVLSAILSEVLYGFPQFLQ